MIFPPQLRGDLWYNSTIEMKPRTGTNSRGVSHRRSSSNHTTKRCSECEIEYPATTEFYHVDKRIKCGLKAACKGCSNQRLIKFRQEHPDKIKKYSDTYAGNHREENARRSAEWAKSNPAKKAEHSKRYNDKYPGKRKAHAAVKYAIRKGILLPVSNFQCLYKGERCKGQATEYHHHDYSEEYILDVIPVCSICHKELEGRG